MWRDVVDIIWQFEKIIVIGMPDRFDKRDSLALAASISGIQLTFEDGVVGENLFLKAIPHSWDRKRNGLSKNLGCWRAHMNVAQR